MSGVWHREGLRRLWLHCSNIARVSADKRWQACLPSVVLYETWSSSSRQSGLEAAVSDSHITCQSASLEQYHFGAEVRFSFSSNTDPASPARKQPPQC